MTVAVAGVGAFLALLGTVFVAYRQTWLTKRRESGKIETTEASKLWDELSEELAIVRAERQQVLAELKSLRESERECHLALAAVRTELETLRTELRRHTNGE